MTFASLRPFAALGNSHCIVAAIAGGTHVRSLADPRGGTSRAAGTR